MADDTEKKAGDDSALKDAEARVRAAEKRAKDLEVADAKRRADEDAAKKKAEADSLEGAKRQLAEIEAREKAANERIAALEKKETERVEARLALLPDDTKARVQKYREKLALDDFASLVEDEVQRSAQAGERPADGLPLMTPGGRGRAPAGERSLHPRTEQLLKDLNVDDRLVRAAVVVEHDGTNKEKGRFNMPVNALIKVMRERAKMPAKLNEDNRAKLLDIAKKAKER